MDSSVAQMTCVLKVNIKCEACRTKIYDVLQNIYGVYKINIDAEEGTVKVSGKVNPSTLLMVLEGSGKHAELKSVTFDGEVNEWGYDYFGDQAGYGYNYNPYAVAPYPYPPLGWFDYQWHDPGRLIMMPLSPPPPPPLPPPSSSIPQQSQSQSLPLQPAALPAPPAGNVANRAVKPEAGSRKKSKCIIM